jgi:hypothetical protein
MSENNSTFGVSVYGPYEQLAIKALDIVGKIIDGQSPEVKAKLWEGYIKDMEAWREFGKSVRAALGIDR